MPDYVHQEFEAYLKCGLPARPDLRGPPRSGRAVGTARVIAETSDRAIEDKAVIDKILTHLGNKQLGAEQASLPQDRAPPVPDLFA